MAYDPMRDFPNLTGKIILIVGAKYSSRAPHIRTVIPTDLGILSDSFHVAMKLYARCGLPNLPGRGVRKRRSRGRLRSLRFYLMLLRATKAAAMIRTFAPTDFLVGPSRLLGVLVLSIKVQVWRPGFNVHYGTPGSTVARNPLVALRMESTDFTAVRACLSHFPVRMWALKVGRVSTLFFALSWGLSKPKEREPKQDANIDRLMGYGGEYPQPNLAPEESPAGVSGG
ncbi:hypothetical protein H4582DRAFT_2129121 [Lactarius indigo]|nr:hypothetical protein H4582DRAFT_2129121 [Lactarius indigo]